MEIIESMFSGYKHVSSQAVAEGERDA
jgi:hypothetical protein